MINENGEIVVALDSSEHGLTAVRWGAVLAQVSGANLTLVHVLEIRYVDNALIADIASTLGAAPASYSFDSYRKLMEEKGKKVLEAGSEVSKSYGVVPVTKLLHGIAHEELSDAAQEAALLIVGRRGENSEHGKHLLGGGGEWTIRHANCSCLVVPEHYTRPERMVVGIHDSERSRAAARWATYLQEVFTGFTIEAIHVDESDDPRKLNLGEIDHIRDTEVEVLRGDPEEVLFERCNVNADKTLCLVGATGHKQRIKEIILGTIPFHLLHRLSGPILIAR